MQLDYLGGGGEGEAQGGCPRRRSQQECHLCGPRAILPWALRSHVQSVVPELSPWTWEAGPYSTLWVEGGPRDLSDLHFQAKSLRQALTEMEATGGHGSGVPREQVGHIEPSALFCDYSL